MHSDGSFLPNDRLHKNSYTLKSPATAHHVSFQLAQYFVADVPPPVLVERMAQTFIATDGDIRQVLSTLFHSAEFWDTANVGNKFKTPYQYVLSVIRTSNIPLSDTGLFIRVLKQMDMPLYGCPTPDGYKTTEAAWLNPEAIIRRVNIATHFANGRLANPELPPVNAENLATTMQVLLSGTTQDVVSRSEPRLRAAMMLASPDFMRH